MIEKERKFLVSLTTASLCGVRLGGVYGTKGKTIESGYFTKGKIAVRVTIRSDGVNKFCIKTPGNTPDARHEFEFNIPKFLGKILMKLSPTQLSKIRYDVDGWEIDVYGCFENVFPEPLVVAEWEESPGKPQIPDPLPEWIAAEITGINSLSNQSLAWRYGKV